LEVQPPTLDDVYRKFGETAEAAQLLETELSNIVLISRGAEAELFTTPNPEIGSVILDTINRRTLGELIKRLNPEPQSLDALETQLQNALRERNRLFQSFHRQHKFRGNSDEGRAIMLTDLGSIHETLLGAYKVVMLLSGVDPNAIVNSGVEHDPPTAHVKSDVKHWRREPAKTKSELREMLAEAVRNTQAENKRLQQATRDRGKEAA
jgi:hypothetical protein